MGPPGSLLKATRPFDLCLSCVLPCLVMFSPEMLAFISRCFGRGRSLLPGADQMQEGHEGRCLRRFGAERLGPDCPFRGGGGGFSEYRVELDRSRRCANSDSCPKVGKHTSSAPREPPLTMGGRSRIPNPAPFGRQGSQAGDQAFKPLVALFFFEMHHGTPGHGV